MSDSSRDFSIFFEAFRGESDRAAAVLGAAYVDAALKRLFRARLVEEPPPKIFDYRGPLGDFVSKIDLAFSLGWIPASLRDDLHIVQKIRNDFAHDPDHLLSFENASIGDRTRNLTVNAQYESMIATATSRVQDQKHAEGMRTEMRSQLLGTPRRRFELAVANAEVFLANTIRASNHAPPNTSQWRSEFLGSFDAPLPAAAPILLADLTRDSDAPAV